MKKILLAGIISAAAVMGFSSCNNGDYDVNPATTASGPNPLVPDGSGGSGGGGGSNSFNWTGTDPMSAKINGTTFTATSGSVTEASGTILVQGMSGTTTLQVSFPSGTANGTTVPITPNVSGTGTGGLFEGTTTFASGGTGTSGGSILVIENDATHCKGKFYVNLKDPTGSGGTRDVTEGYFNITK